jgi:hypothetical protein
MNVRCLIAPFVIAGGLLAGCGDDRSGAAFAAPVEGSDAFVGVVVNEDDGEVLA